MNDGRMMGDHNRNSTIYVIIIIVIAIIIIIVLGGLRADPGGILLLSLLL